MLAEGIVYSIDASAGSGKTTSIVYNMVKILLQPGSSHRQILGMTFTNKAANELKSKLLKVLSEIATDETKIPKDLHGNSYDIQQQAYKLWIQILHDYNSLKISTLDKFFLTLIRSHSKELGVNTGFKTELETDKIVEEAIQNVFQEASVEDNLLSKVLTQFALDKVREGKSWKIEYELEKIAQRLFSDEDFPYISYLVQLDFEKTNEILQHTKAEIQRFEKNISQIHQEFEGLMEEKDWEVDDFVWKKKGFGGLGLRFEMAKKSRNYTKLLNTITQKQFISGEFAKKGTKSYYDIQNCEEISILLEKLENTLKTQGKYLLFRAIRENMYSLSVLHVLALELQKIKLQKNIVLVSDVNKMITSAQLTEETNFLFWKLADRFKYYFLDEFQDTNLLQYINLLPLLKEIPANAQGNVWIVGDAKQAIYRWRGGNAEEVYAKLENDLSPEKNNLKSNWRSAPEIVNFNNLLFSNIIQFTEIKPITKHFYNILQKPEKTNVQGSVEVIALKSLKNNSDKNLTEISMQMCLEYIERVLADGKHKLSDIAVIVRKNSEAALIAEVIQNQGYAVRSTDALSLHKHPKVQCIIAILQLISHPDDTLALLEISTLLKQFDGDNNEIYWTNNNFEEIKNKLVSFAKLPTIQAYEEIIQTFEFNQESDAYITRLGDVIREFSSENSSSIPDFLIWWKDYAEKVKLIQSGADAIEILTVHKSKGLQFPVVLLPFADWKVSPKPRSFIWFQSSKILENTPVLIPVTTKLLDSEANMVITKEYEQTATDNLHLLYVALTRAEKNMLIVMREGIAEQKTSISIDKFKNCADWILRALPQANSTEEHENFTSYSFGNQLDNSLSQEVLAKEETCKIFPISKQFKEKITLRRYAKEFWPREENFRSQQIEHGILIHRAFEYITDNQSITFSLQKLIFEGLLISSEAEVLQNDIEKWLNNEEIHKYFESGWEILNERELVTKHKIYRPDRVQLNSSEVIIMDYKTGIIRLEDETQLLEYKEMMKNIYPNHKIKSCLIYFGLNQIKWL